MGDHEMHTASSHDTLVAVPERQDASRSAPGDVKRESTIETVEVPPYSPSSPHPPPPRPPPRRGSSFRIQVEQQLELLTSSALRPFWGLLCLSLSICCVFFSLAILVTSHNRPVESWQIQPTVYLAIAAALSQTLIQLAYTQATVIAWWYRASKGATIRALERQWEASTGLFSPRYYIQHPSWLVVATLLVWSMIADGPMLQRAASVVSATQSNMMPFNVSLSPELPTGFSGQRMFDYIDETDSVPHACRNWTAQTPISLDVRPACKGSCAGTVRGPGVTKTHCSTKTWPITEEMYHSPNATWGEWPMRTDNMANTSQPANPIFQIRMGIHIDGPGNPVAQEAAVLITGMINVSNSSGTFEQTKCYWIPAILEYDVVFSEEGYVKLLQDPANAEGKVMALANNTVASPLWVEGPEERPSTLDFMTDYLRAFVSANSSALAPVAGDDIAAGVWHQDASTFNSQSWKYLNFSIGLFDNKFLDPVPDIIHELNEIFFRGAVLATATWPNITQLIDPGLDIHQNIVANQTVTQNVYHSDFTWFAAATVLDLVVVLAVLPLFWGFWKLDRQLNLSPCSMALAFNAPLFREADTERGAEGLVKQYGDMWIRYGEIAEEQEGVMLPSAPSRRFQSAKRVDSMASSRKGFGRCRDMSRR